MSILESAVERKCVEYAAKKGILSIKIKGLAGWPDRLFFIKDGTVFFVEFKRPGEAPRPLQVHVHNLLKEYNIPVFIIDKFDQFKRLLEVEL